MIDGRKEELLKDFGENLKKIRTGKNISLRDLAAAAELEHAQIARIENGEINPTYTTIIFLAEALHVDPAVLVSPK